MDQEDLRLPVAFVSEQNDECNSVETDNEESKNEKLQLETTEKDLGSIENLTSLAIGDTSLKYCNGKTYAEIGKLDQISTTTFNSAVTSISPPAISVEENVRETGENLKSNNIHQDSPSDVYAMDQPLQSIYCNPFPIQVDIEENQIREFQTFLSNYNHMRAIIENTATAKSNIQCDSYNENSFNTTNAATTGICLKDTSLEYGCLDNYVHQNTSDNPTIDCCRNMREKPFSNYLSNYENMILMENYTEQNNSHIDSEYIRNEQNSHDSHGENKFEIDSAFSLDAIGNLEIESLSFDDVKGILDTIDPSNNIESNMFVPPLTQNGDNEDKQMTMLCSLPDAFSIWKEKFRALVEEEYPKAENDEIDKHLEDIWKKIPNDHREKYYIKANALVQKLKVDLIDKYTSKICTKKKSVKRKLKRSKSSNSKNKVIKPNPIRPLVPKLAPAFQSEENDSDDNSHSNCDHDDALIQYNNALKETMTYNSSDKDVKKKLSKMKIDSNQNFDDENHLATGFLEDVMIAGNNYIEQKSAEYDFDSPLDNIRTAILTDDVIDTSDFSSYSSVKEIFIENKTIQEEFKRKREKEKKTRKSLNLNAYKKGVAVVTSEDKYFEMDKCPVNKTERSVKEDNAEQAIETRKHIDSDCNDEEILKKPVKSNQNECANTNSNEDEEKAVKESKDVNGNKKKSLVSKKKGKGSENKNISSEYKDYGEENYILSEEKGDGSSNKCIDKVDIEEIFDKFGENSQRHEAKVKRALMTKGSAKTKKLKKSKSNRQKKIRISARIIT